MKTNRRKELAVVEDNKFYKNNETDSVWWVNNIGFVGIREFSFDKKDIFNLFRDYPEKLTAEQKEIFDKENPFWAEFFNP
jgi:hypothetical protein